MHRHNRATFDRSKPCLECRQRYDKSYDGAVAVADNNAFTEPMVLLLVAKDFEVVDIDGWGNKGHERVTAMILCVGEKL